jgi:hypothetical protein
MRNLIVVAVLCLCSWLCADSYDCFIRGDANGDDSVDIADAIAVSNYVSGGSPPLNDNMDALDANDDGSINIADSIYISGMLFNSLPYLVPNFITGAGTDPTPDNVNNEGGDDLGDYLAGESVSHYAASGSVSVFSIAPELPAWWPDHDTTHAMDTYTPTGETWDHYHWQYMTNPSGTYGELGNLCGFHSGAGGSNAEWDITGTIGTARKISKACTDDITNSGPGVNIRYKFSWILKAEEPSLWGLTNLVIDGSAVEFKFTFNTMLGTGIPSHLNEFVVSKTFDFGKYGLAVYSYNRAMVIATWGSDWDNSSNDVTGTPSMGYQCEGDTEGMLVVTTKDIAEAMAEVPTILDTDLVYLKDFGAYTLDEGLEVWHFATSGDASEYDEAQCLFDFWEPRRAVTSWDNP